MKRKTLTVISIVLILVLAITFTAFARGRGSNQVKIQLDTNSYKKVEPAIKNLYESLKNLISKEVSSGIISNYYAESIIKNIDAAYSQIMKTKTIYLPFFGGMGFKGPKNQPPFAGQSNQPSGQGPQNNQGQPNQGNPPAGAPGFGQGFGPMYQNQLTDAQIQAFKSLTPDVLKVIDAEISLGKALKDGGIITDLQLSSYLSRLEYIKTRLTQFPMVHYGIMSFLMMAGFNYNN
ncbi:MAG: hypothetical protein NUV32_06555 [Exilispira sp.]|jgi:hypothetical protein|nr:hypothetical protein [Exilispira sp.]